MMNHRKKSLLSLALIAALSSHLYGAESNEEIVQSIMKLRADVESLYTKIDENKENYKAQMKSLAMQSADNKAQINRTETSLKLAHLELEKIKVQIEAASSGNIELKPLLEKGMNLLKGAINASLPFKTKERLDAIDAIKTQLDEGLITQEKALALLWACYDDTLRLSREIGLFKQEIELNGEKLLAKVVKLGTIMMFFQTADERVGYVTKNGDAYTYHLAKDENEQKQVAALFDALNKQIRTGYFTLPNALVLMEEKQ